MNHPENEEKQCDRLLALEWLFNNHLAQRMHPAIPNKRISP